MPFLTGRMWSALRGEISGRISSEVSSSTAKSTGVRYPSKRIAPLVAVRQNCGNPECASRWKSPWRNPRRPVLEGKWGCSRVCLEAIIQRSLLRERKDLRHFEQQAPHRHRVPVGLILLEKGLVTQDQLRGALATQRTFVEKSVGSILMKEYGVSAAAVTQALAVQWSCPVLSGDGFVPETAVRILPRVLVERYGMLPLRIAGSQLIYLACQDRPDASVAFAVEQMSGLNVVTGLMPEEHCSEIQGRLLTVTFPSATHQTYTGMTDLGAQVAAALEQALPQSSRIVRVHEHYWLRCWLEADSFSGVGTLPASNEGVREFVFSPAS